MNKIKKNKQLKRNRYRYINSDPVTQHTTLAPVKTQGKWTSNSGFKPQDPHQYKFIILVKIIGLLPFKTIIKKYSFSIVYH